MIDKHLAPLYRRLPYLEKRVLQLKYLSSETISSEDFCAVIDASNLKDRVVASLNQKSIKKMLERFASQGFLSYRDMRPNQAMYECVVTDAFTDKESGDNINAFLKCKPECADALVMGLHSNNENMFKSCIQPRPSHAGDAWILDRIDSCLAGKSTDENWLNSLAKTIQYYVLAARAARALSRIGHTAVSNSEMKVVKQAIEKNIDFWILGSKFIVGIFLEYFLMLGDSKMVSIIAARRPQDHALRGIEAFLEDNNDAALDNFEQATLNLRKQTGSSVIVLTGIYGLFQVLSLLKAKRTADAAMIVTQQKKLWSGGQWTLSTREASERFIGRHRASQDLFASLIDFLEKPKAELSFGFGHAIESVSRLDEVIFILVGLWTNVDKIIIQNWCDKFRPNRNRWFGFGSIIFAVERKLSDKQLQVSSPYKVKFEEIVEILPEWDRTIKALDRIFTKPEQGQLTVVRDKRLIWRLYPNRTYDMIEATEQTKKKNGDWNAGRVIATHRLYDYNPDHLTLQDKKVIATIRNNDYFNRYSATLVQLIGHPLVFDGDKHVELVPASLELEVNDAQGQYNIKLSNAGRRLIKESDRVYKVKGIDPQEEELVKLIANGLSVPAEAKDKVFGMLQKASEFVTVQATINDESLETTPARNESIVQLIPGGDEGLRVRLLTRPFPQNSMACVPGKGMTSLVLFSHGACKRIARNFEDEINVAARTVESLATLKKYKAEDYEWHINKLEDSLEVLSELEKHEGTVEWPKGKPFALENEISFESLSLSIKSQQQWFEFEGQVQLDESKVIDMTALLSQLDSGSGRFIKLDDKRFVALKSSFYQRLQELNIASSNGRINRLGSSLISEFAKEAQKFEADDLWQQHIKRIDLSQKHAPKICSTLKASLRSYQEDGYKWLSRLCFLRCGAALCDDMGLGKTLQAITLLLEQAKFGPCLVIAPASVCYVWEEECKKFAPALRVATLASEDRAQQIEKLNAMDVLVVSYGMLPNVEGELTKKEWQVVVLDEAQAIKNFGTKRFEVATRLKATNRIALSGTPIENKLFELWSLFEFLNPGLLGSKTTFYKRYVRPIEQEKNALAQATLKKLVTPFILRRTKEQVLTELPEKIEQTVFVEPSAEEKSFYEALRRKSVDKIAELASEKNPGKRSLSIFTEIIKLKRACCDSSLIDNSIEIANSKLQAFDELVDELLENGHKALVFSQYVDYLTIIRSRLDKKKICYQYLDGSTSLKSRKESIEAFQSGKGDLFLISLKAGGTGLNLTAADYVIHLDPWWNPAVEEQASARAYRMGQTKQTTIYRFIMKHSIEEKILKMHSEKRELASRLLEGTDMTSRLTEKDLLELILQ